MGEMSFEQRSSVFYITGSLLCVVVLALMLRLAFWGGMVTDEGMVNAKTAFQIAQMLDPKAGVPFDRDWAQQLAQIGRRQFLFALPVGVLYAGLGASDLASLILPLTSSLLGLGFVYGIGYRLAGEKAGLISAFLWAVLPMEVMFAGSLVKNTLVFTLSTGAVFFFLGGEATAQRRWRLASYFACTGLLVLAMALDLTGWIPLIFLVVVYVWKNHRRALIPLAGILAAAWLALGTLFWQRFDKPFSWAMLTTLLDPLYRHLIETALLPWVFAAIILWVKIRPAGFAVLWLWVASTYPFYALYVYSGYNGYVTFDHVALPTLAPLVIAVGAYLGQGLDKGFARGAVALGAAVVGLTGWAVSRAQPVWMPPVDDDLGYRLLTLRSILTFSKITSGLIFLGGIASVGLIKGGRPIWKQAVLVGLLWMIGFSMLYPISTHSDPQKQRTAVTKQAYAFLEKRPLDFSVYVDTPTLLAALDYLSGFQWGGDGTLTLLPGNPSEVGSAYVLLSSQSNMQTPARWWPMAQFHQPRGATYWVYRALAPDAAKKVWAGAQRQGQDSAKPQEYYDLYGVAINIGKLCEGYRYWIQFARGGVNELVFIPVVQSCSFLEDGKNLLDGQWLLHTGNTTVIQPVIDPETGETTLELSKRYIFDRETIYQKSTLEPDSIYLLEVDVLAEHRVVGLYWKIDDREYLLDAGRAYPQWQHLAVLIATPNGQSGARTAVISPLLDFSEELETIYYGVKNARLIKIET